MWHRGDEASFYSDEISTHGDGIGQIQRKEMTLVRSKGGRWRRPDLGGGRLW
jgi:hypothetical protein